MITLLRVDDRLIHGQVAVVWTSYLHADTIVVGNDKAANDAFTTMALNLAKPPGVALHILTLEKASAFCNDPGNQTKKIFIVVENTSDALALATKIDGIHQIILGGIRKSGDKRLIDRQVFLDAQDLQNCKEMETLGKKVTISVVPSERSYTLTEAEHIYSKK